MAPSRRGATYSTRRLSRDVACVGGHLDSLGFGKSSWFSHPTEKGGRRGASSTRAVALSVFAATSVLENDDMVGAKPL